MDNKFEISELISKYLSGEASPEEAIQLEDWKTLSEANLIFYNDCVKIYNATGFIPITQLDTESAWQAVNAKIAGKNTVVKSIIPDTVLKWAAVLIMIFTTGFFLQKYFNPSSYDTISYQSVANSKWIDLNDNSKVELLPFSKIILSKDYGQTNRTVKLFGSAEFTVKHQDSLPFMVDVGNLFIKDIGTIFSVKQSADTDTVFVHVNEGVVLMFDSAGTEITLEASESAIYVKSQKQIVSPRPEKIKPELFFNSSKLETVVKQLSEKFHTTITLGNSGLEDCLITAEFGPEQLETILVVVTETLGLQFTKTDKGYIITGKPCNP